MDDRAHRVRHEAYTDIASAPYRPVVLAIVIECQSNFPVGLQPDLPPVLDAPPGLG